jgi:hypothetical protein
MIIFYLIIYNICVTCVLLNTVVGNFHRSFCTLGQFVTLKHVPCVILEGQELHKWFQSD